MSRSAIPPRPLTTLSSSGSLAEREQREVALRRRRRPGSEGPRAGSSEVAHAEGSTSSTRACNESDAARGMLSCRPAQAARRNDSAFFGRRSSSEPTSRRNAKICRRVTLSRNRGRLAQRRADVDHALVLDRDEVRADSHRHVLDVGEDLVAHVIARRRTCTAISSSSTGRASRPASRSSRDQPVPVGDSGRFDLKGVAHRAGLSLTRRPRNSVETRYGSGAMAVATGREYGLFIGGESAEAASGETRDLVEPATGAALATVCDGERGRTSTVPSTAGAVH